MKRLAKVSPFLGLFLFAYAGCSGGSTSQPDGLIPLSPNDASASVDAANPNSVNDAFVAVSNYDTAFSGALDSANVPSIDSTSGSLPDVVSVDVFVAVSPDVAADVTAVIDGAVYSDAPQADVPAITPDAVLTSGPDTVPAVLKANVRVLTDISLKSSTVNDTSIILAKSGNEDLLLLPAGEILGSFDGGFLRRVVSVSSDAATITIATEDASLTDAVETGEIETSFVFGTEADPYQQSPTTEYDFEVDGGTFPVHPHAAMPMSLGVDLSGKSLYSSGGISLVLTQASVKYVPTCTVRMAVRKNRVTSFSTALLGNLKMAFQPTLSASASYTTPTASANLWTSPTYRFYQTIGALPVGEEVRLFLDAKINATASGKVSVSGGVEGGGNLSLGVTYRNGVWDAAASAPLNFSSIDPTVTGEASLGYTVTITPRVEIIFFPLNKHLVNVGVSLSTDAASTLEGKYESEKCPRAIDWKASMNLKGTAKTGLSVLDNTFLPYTGTVFNTTFQLGSGSIDMKTNGVKCGKDEKAYCGKNDVFMCCPPESPYFCDTGKAETAGCWKNSAQACSTITYCGGKWNKCAVDGEVPYCGAVTKEFQCCPAGAYFLDKNTIAGNGSCWTFEIDPATMVDCGGKIVACAFGGWVADCAQAKCVKSGS